MVPDFTELMIERITSAFNPQIIIGIFTLNISYFLRYTVLQSGHVPPLFRAIGNILVSPFLILLETPLVLCVESVWDLLFCVRSPIFCIQWFPLFLIYCCICRTYCPEASWEKGYRSIDCIWGKILQLYISENIITWPSHLIDSLVVYRILDWNSFSFKFLKAFFQGL